MAVTSALATDSAARAGLSRDQLLELYYWMRLTRSLEERLVNLYRQTKVVGGLFRSGVAVPRRAPGDGRGGRRSRAPSGMPGS